MIDFFNIQLVVIKTQEATLTCCKFAKSFVQTIMSFFSSNYKLQYKPSVWQFGKSGTMLKKKSYCFNLMGPVNNAFLNYCNSLNIFFTNFLMTCIEIKLSKTAVLIYVLIFLAYRTHTVTHNTTTSLIMSLTT